MGNPSVRRAGKPCRRCGVVFRAKSNHKRQVFCGRRCSALSRSRASRVAAGRKGGLTGSAKRRGLRLAEIRARVRELPAASAWRDGFRWGQRRLASRVQSARRDGFSQGYEAALKDMDMRRTA